LAGVTKNGTNYYIFLIAKLPADAGLVRRDLGVGGDAPFGRCMGFVKNMFSSNKVVTFFKVLYAKPLILTLYNLRQVCHNISTIPGDRPTQQCDPCTVATPKRYEVGSFLMPIPYDPQRGFQEPALPVPVATRR